MTPHQSVKGTKYGTASPTSITMNRDMLSFVQKIGIRNNWSFTNMLECLALNHFATVENRPEDVIPFAVVF